MFKIRVKKENNIIEFLTNKKCLKLDCECLENILIREIKTIKSVNNVVIRPNHIVEVFVNSCTDNDSIQDLIIDDIIKKAKEIIIEEIEDYERGEVVYMERYQIIMPEIDTDYLQDIIDNKIEPDGVVEIRNYDCDCKNEDNRELCRSCKNRKVE